MFHHVKELQFNARVSGPDPRFASLLLEQFGGPNGELAACMQYFVQAFGARRAHPKKYDMLMDIATEEISHLEIVGATITMLLEGVKGELKNAAGKVGWMQMIGGKDGKEEMIHQAFLNPQFFVRNAGGGPTLTDSQGVPFSGNHIDANGDLTVDLRSDMAAESRAKLTYELLMQHTDDPYIQETLGFLMTREIAHFKMFQSALADIQDNFPMGTLEGDPRYTHTYYNMSNGEEMRGPWNEGQGEWEQGTWQYIQDPIRHVRETQGLTTVDNTGTMTQEQRKASDKMKSKMRSKKEKAAAPKASKKSPEAWTTYPADKA